LACIFVDLGDTGDSGDPAVQLSHMPLLTMFSFCLLAIAWYMAAEICLAAPYM